MIEGNPQPLAIAARVLKPETLDQIRRLSDYNLRGWQILDRWAFNNAAQLQELENEGEVIFLSRLLEQQRLEQNALMNKPANLSETEILEINNISTELYFRPW